MIILIILIPPKVAEIVVFSLSPNTRNSFGCKKPLSNVCMCVCVCIGGLIMYVMSPLCVPTMIMCVCVCV